MCWGSNSAGQIGNGETDNAETPDAVNDISTATDIAAGSLHTCAVLENGRVKCWGYNLMGQLGNGESGIDYIENTEPGRVSNISSATQVSAGAYYTCALLEDSTVNCWGFNYKGQLGNGTTDTAEEPEEVDEISSASQIDCGGNHACALLDDGSMKCWGYNYSGQLGNGESGSDADSSTPVDVSDISSISQITGGAYHTCAVIDDATLKCWGQNEDGQMGNETNTDADTPADVTF